MADSDGTLKRGLVLAGGGAKGAYAFGVMQALVEAGVSFVQVAGTSVGALNALLWSTQAFEEGERIWSNLSFESVYPVVIAPGSTNPRILWVRGIIHVLSNLLLATFNGVPSEVEIPMRIVLGLLGLVFFVGIPCLFYGPIGLAGLIFWAYTIWSPKSEALRGFRTLAFYGAGLFYLVGVYEFIKSFLSPAGHIFGPYWDRIPSLPHYHDVGNGWETFYFILIAPFVVVACLLVSFFLMLLGVSIMEWFQAKSEIRTVFDRSPLQNTVATLLASRQLSIPTWVTTGVLGEQENSKYSTVPAIAGIDPSGGANVRLIQRIDTAWLPRYTELRSKPIELQEQYCVASAALPFGLTTPMEIDGVKHVDGGVVDNCPLWPSTVEGINEVFVVLLSSHKNEKSALDEALAATMKAGDYPPLIVHCFYPKETLGSFISGTLNFSPAYAQKLLLQGRRDGRERLLELGIRKGNPVR